MPPSHWSLLTLQSTTGYTWRFLQCLPCNTPNGCESSEISHPHLIPRLRRFFLDMEIIRKWKMETIRSNNSEMVSIQNLIRSTADDNSRRRRLWERLILKEDKNASCCRSEKDVADREQAVFSITERAELRHHEVRRSLRCEE